MKLSERELISALRTESKEGEKGEKLRGKKEKPRGRVVADSRRSDRPFFDPLSYS